MQVGSNHFDQNTGLLIVKLVSLHVIKMRPHWLIRRTMKNTTKSMHFARAFWIDRPQTLIHMVWYRQHRSMSKVVQSSMPILVRKWTMASSWLKWGRSQNNTQLIKSKLFWIDPATHRTECRQTCTWSSLASMIHGIGRLHRSPNIAIYSSYKAPKQLEIKSD